MTAMSRPMPLPTPTSQPYWDGLARHEVWIQFSPSLDSYVFYPRMLAPGTLADDLEWRQISGAGTLVSFAVAERPVAPQFADAVPQLARRRGVGRGPAVRHRTGRRRTRRTAGRDAGDAGVHRLPRRRCDPAAVHGEAVGAGHGLSQLTDEQIQITDAMAASPRATPHSARPVPHFDSLAAGQRPAFWADLVAHGLHAVGLPESVGGQGGELAEAACVIDAAGYALLPGPLLPTVIAGAVAAAAEPGPAAAPLLDAIASGSTARRRVAAGRPVARHGDGSGVGPDRCRRPGDRTRRGGPDRGERLHRRGRGAVVCPGPRCIRCAGGGRDAHRPDPCRRHPAGRRPRRGP